jgi:3',5'-cyclic AMP phosphodiesterase CpdA
MHKKNLNRITFYLSLVLFISGTICITIHYESVKNYNNAYVRNYLPPAGEFIKGNNEFSFAVMGDSGLRDEPLEIVLKDIINHNYPFVLNVGDQARKLMTSNFELLLQTNNKILGDFPFYAVPGNHDVVYDKSDKPEDYLRFYNRAFGQAYYWFTYGNTLFIGLDTSRGTFYKKQQEWLKTTLSKLRSSYKSCIVFMHIPPIDPRHGQKYCMGKTDSDRLKSVLDKYNITAILAGHIHEYNASKFGNIPLYIAPPSGQKMRGKQKQYGYLKCTIEKNGQLNVKNVNVTKASGRDYFRYYLSTEAQIINLFYIGLVCIIISWLLAVYRRTK